MAAPAFPVPTTTIRPIASKSRICSPTCNFRPRRRRKLFTSRSGLAASTPAFQMLNADARKLRLRAIDLFPCSFNATRVLRTPID